MPLPGQDHGDARGRVASVLVYSTSLVQGDASDDAMIGNGRG